MLSRARGHTRGGWPELCWGQRQSPLSGLRPVNEELRRGSGHTIKGLMAALGAQCPASEVATTGHGCVVAGMSAPWLATQFPPL